MTSTEWIRQNYADHGRDYVINGIETCREATGHGSSASTWDRQVRRVIREVEGNGPEPEESFQVKTIEDSLSYHDVPEHLFEVKKAKVNTWGGPQNPNQQVSIELKAKDQTLDPEKWAEAFRQAVSDLPKGKREKAHKTKDDDLVHLLSIPDMHFGKMVEASTVGGETAQDYTPEIASELYLDSVRKLSESINSKTTKEIVFPNGEDFFNVDNLSDTTTAGTPQKNSDVYTMIRTGMSALFQAIDHLAEIANVRVPVVAGNHDRLLSFMSGIILEERYANDDRVTIEATPVREKIYQCGNFAFLLIHGDRLKQKDLSWRMATKYPQVWGTSKHRFVYSGHFHTSTVIDDQGVIVSYLPTLSPVGSWEDSMNYYSTRQAQLHTFHKERGRIFTSYYTPV